MSLWWLLFEWIVVLEIDCVIVVVSVRMDSGA